MSKTDQRSVEQLGTMFSNMVSMRAQLINNIHQVNRIVEHHAAMTAIDLTLSSKDLITELNDITANLNAAEQEVMHMMDMVRQVSPI